MSYSYESANTVSTTYENENLPLFGERVGSPIGLLLALTFANEISGYSTETKNTASETYESKNTA